MSRGVPVRVAFLAAGLVGLGFGFTFVQTGDDGLEGFTRAILRGETFEPELLDAVLAAHPPDVAGCDADELRNLAILQSQSTDAVLSSDAVDAFDGATRALLRAADRLIACSPRESFGWLMRYWAEARLQGLGDAALVSLGRSYAFGPREAWVAVRRNAMALAIFPFLPPALQDAALREFGALLALQIFDTPIGSIAAAPPPLRERLYEVAAALPESVRVNLALALRARRLPTRALALPAQPARPWRND